jgi:hypothetical protein
VAWCFVCIANGLRFGKNVVFPSFSSFNVFMLSPIKLYTHFSCWHTKKRNDRFSVPSYATSFFLTGVCVCFSFSFFSVPYSLSLLCASVLFCGGTLCFDVTMMFRVLCV